MAGAPVVSSIASTQQTIAVDQVLSIVVTDVVQVSDQFIREVRIFGSPDGISAPAVFILRLSGLTADAVKLLTPELAF